MILHCVNGHAILDGDEFCGTCGAPAAPQVGQCPNGHTNPEGFTYCGTCGHQLDAPPTAEQVNEPARREVAPEPDIKRDKDHAATLTAPSRVTPRAWLVISIVAIAAILAMVVLTSGDDEPDDSPMSDDAAEETTTTTSISDVCWEELGAWLTYMTGNRDTRAAGYEFGVNSTEHDILIDAYTTWLRTSLGAGRQAANDAANQILSDGCENLGDEYIPGHPAPG